MKADISLAEEKCRQAQQEATTLRTDIRQQESIEADLRTQLRKAKNETEEVLPCLINCKAVIILLMRKQLQTL